MLLWENILLAINSLRSNKMRALLTMLGIIIGIGSVIAIVTVGNALTLSVSENMQSVGANDIYVIVSPRSDSTDEEDDEEKEKAKANKIVDGIKYGHLESTSEYNDEDLLSPEMLTDMCERFKDDIYAIILMNQVGHSDISRGNKNAGVDIMGVTPGFFIINKMEYVKGGVFSEREFEEGKNVVIVADKLVEKLFDGDNDKALGSEIELLVDNQVGTFTIVGIYEYEQQAQTGMIIGSGSNTYLYMPLKTANLFTHNDSGYMYTEVITKVGVNPDELATRLKNFFEPYYRNNNNFYVTTFTMSSMLSMLTTMLGTITTAISIVAGIALIVGGIGVMNIMLVSITERTKEIGTRKALGAKNSSIRTQFIVEAMIICLIGGFFGVIVGVGGGMIASHILGYPAKPSISAIIISLIFSMIIGVFFGYYPANKAAKMNPIDALRYE